LIHAGNLPVRGDFPQVFAEHRAAACLIPGQSPEIGEPPKTVGLLSQQADAALSTASGLLGAECACQSPAK
jgi:hypothetical protein